MRLRKIANAENILKNNSQYVKLVPQEFKGKWKAFFNNSNPIHIEVGMGKGQFIINMAKNYPEINYIGIEVVQSVMVRSVEKLKEAKLQNVILVCIDANFLNDVFENGEVERIYLNFSDPWPKKRHEKRRLTHHTFLSIFKEILLVDGEIHFKTDNQKLFEYSIISMSHFNMEFNYISLDLHKSNFEKNIMTEYEERFHSQGQRIYRMEANFK